jgi:hypothetical protein
LRSLAAVLRTVVAKRPAYFALAIPANAAYARFFAFSVPNVVPAATYASIAAFYAATAVF